MFWYCTTVYIARLRVRISAWATQPSIPLGLVNEYQLRLGRQRQVWLIPIADERVGVQVKLCDPLRTRAIPEHFCGVIQYEEPLYQVYAPLYANIYQRQRF